MSREDLVRGLPHLLRTATATDLLRHRPALGDDGLGFLPAHRLTVDVPELVGGPSSEHRPPPLRQVRSDHAQSFEVVRFALHHLRVVDLSELGIDRSGCVGGAKQLRAKQR